MAVRLENWSLVTRVSNPYQAPELGVPCLHGLVYGHPKLPDGYEMSSSRVVKTEGEDIITESGTHYELGQIDPEYEKIYPNAKQRLIESLKKIES